MAPMMGLVTSALGRLTETLMFEISSERFEELAQEVLTALPLELAAKIGNLAITINDTALDENLFGLYEGIPLTKRGPIS
jgi:predicted Zn-dependent protease with MMP-like domain